MNAYFGVFVSRLECRFSTTKTEVSFRLFHKCVFGMLICRMHNRSGVNSRSCREMCLLLPNFPVWWTAIHSLWSSIQSSSPKLIRPLSKSQLNRPCFVSQSIQSMSALRSGVMRISDSASFFASASYQKRNIHSSHNDHRLVICHVYRLCLVLHDLQPNLRATSSPAINTSVPVSIRTLIRYFWYFTEMQKRAPGGRRPLDHAGQ